MTDYSGNTDPSVEFNLQFDRRLADAVHTSIPAILNSFDSATQTVSAIPAIKIKIVDPETGNIRYLDRPLITNIPLAVNWSFGAGLGATFPFVQGDICTLFFAERSLDNFLISGEISAPTDGPTPDTCTIRCFDQTDAMCFLGVIAKQKIANYNPSAVEIRNADKTTYMSVASSSLTMVQGSASITIGGGKIAIVGDIEHTGNLTQTGNTTSSGTVTATDCISGAISGLSHTHGGVTPGQGSTGAPQ